MAITILFHAPAICSAASNAENGERKNVLVLHSSHKGLAWNDRLSNGIESVFSESKYQVRIFYEYLDSERFFDNHHIQNLYELYKHKFNIINFDAAIITDDQAFQFMLKYHSRLLPNTPVVFCGVNYFTVYDLYRQDQFTGIVQKIDIDETLALALSLNPMARNAFVVVDKTSSSIAAIQLFIENMNKYKDRLSFYFNEDTDMDELLQAVNGLPSDWIVIIVNFAVDKSGRTYSIEQSTRMISQNANVPVYSFWDRYLGHGILGGKLISGSAQGKLSAQMVLRLFAGESPSAIDIIRKSPNTYMFDYQVLKKFQIDMKSLPEHSLIINKPMDFYGEYKTIIWTISLWIAMLFGTIVILSINVLRRKKAEKYLKKYSNQLEIQHKIDRAILEARPTEKIANDTLKFIRNLFLCRRVSVVLFDYEQQKAVVLAADSDPSTTIEEKSEFPLNDFPIDELKKGNIIYAKDIRLITVKSKSDFALMSNMIFSYVRLPLIYHDKLLGILTIGHSDFSVFNEDSVQVVKQISASLALAIQTTIFMNNILQRERDLKIMSASLIRSQEDERKKISLELHDELGQALTAMNMNLSLLEKKIITRNYNDHKIMELVHDIADSIQTMAKQIRGLSHELRPPLLDVLGLLPALKAHITGVQKQTGITVHLEAEHCEEKLTPEVEINLFRIIQEALHNVVKHASSSKVCISLRRNCDIIHLTITDNGKGFNKSMNSKSEPSSGIGILGMQERSTNLGGQFSIISTENTGTKIDVQLPITHKLRRTFEKDKVIIAEDHTIVRKGLCSLLEGESDIVVIGEAENGRKLIDLVSTLVPDVIVADINMPLLNGIDVTRNIKKTFPEIEVIILTMYSNEEYVQEALLAGASGFLLKDTVPHDLCSAIRAVANKQSYLSPSISRTVIDRYTKLGNSGIEKNEALDLTMREKEILQLIAEGYHSKKIGEMLFISPKTVDVHRQNIQNKLNIFGTAGLTKYAILKGLIKLE